MAQKENQRIALTKKLLQEGLLRLLETKTLDRISVTELCRESGINRATFYNHYNSPQELLASIEGKIVDDIRTMITPSVSSADIVTIVEAICAYFFENARTVLTLHACGADEQITAVLYEFNRNYQLIRLNDKFARYAPRARQEGLHLITTFFYTGCYHLILEWLAKDINATPKEIATLMVLLAKENFLE